MLRSSSSRESLDKKTFKKTDDKHVTEFEETFCEEMSSTTDIYDIYGNKDDDEDEGELKEEEELEEEDLIEGEDEESKDYESCHSESEQDSTLQSHSSEDLSQINNYTSSASSLPKLEISTIASKPTESPAINRQLLSAANNPVISKSPIDSPTFFNTSIQPFDMSTHIFDTGFLEKK